MRFLLRNTPMILLWAGVVAALIPSPAAFSCFNLPHQWSMIRHVEAAPAEGYFGLMNAIFSWRKDLQPSLGSETSALPTLRIVSVKDSRASSKGHLASGTLARLGKALHGTWHSPSSIPSLDGAWETGDILDIVASHPEWPETLFATVEILRDDEESFNFLDLIFSRWVLLREVQQANTRLVLKTTDRSGKLVSLSEKNVSPLLLLDTWIGPGGCYQTYLEKRDQQPMTFNFCEAISRVSAASCSALPGRLFSPGLPLVLQSNPSSSLPLETEAGN